VTRGSPWDLLTVLLAAVIMQYVWRVQEYLPLLGQLFFTPLVSVGALVLFLAANRPARNTRWVLANGTFRAAGIIVVLAVLSVPTSLHPRGSFTFLKEIFLPTAVLATVLAMSVRDRADVERLVRVFVLGGAAYVIMAMRQASGDRLSGMGMYDPNDLGLVVVATIPLCAYMARRGAHAADRILAGGSALLLLVGLVRTGSRGGFLALVALAAYGLLGVTAIASRKRLVWAVVGGAVLLGVTGPDYWLRMSTILSPQEDYNWGGNSEAGRVEVWKRGIGYMLRDPLTGVGVVQFARAEGTMAPQAGRQAFGIGFKWSTAHNSYVEIGAELGVLGLAAFVTLLFRSLRAARRIARTTRSRDDRLLAQAFGGVLVAYIVGGAFISQAYSAFLYFVLGLLVAFEGLTYHGNGRASPGGHRRAVGTPLAHAPAPTSGS
jgi:O-antigen ligase